MLAPTGGQGESYAPTLCQKFSVVRSPSLILPAMAENNEKKNKQTKN